MKILNCKIKINSCISLSLPLSISISISISISLFSLPFVFVVWMALTNLFPSKAIVELRSKVKGTTPGETCLRSLPSKNWEQIKARHLVNWIANSFALAAGWLCHVKNRKNEYVALCETACDSLLEKILHRKKYYEVIRFFLWKAFWTV